MNAPNGYVIITKMEDIKSCFDENSIQKIWSKNGKIYVAITENENWWKNMCVLQDWYFDYEKFKTLNMHVDCESYGVYVFWLNLLCMKCNTEHEGNWCPEAEPNN